MMQILCMIQKSIVAQHHLSTQVPIQRRETAVMITSPREVSLQMKGWVTENGELQDCTTKVCSSVGKSLWCVCGRCLFGITSRVHNRRRSRGKMRCAALVMFWEKRWLTYAWRTVLSSTVVLCTTVFKKSLPLHTAELTQVTVADQLTQPQFYYYICGYTGVLYWNTGVCSTSTWYWSTVLPKPHR